MLSKDTKMTLEELKEQYTEYIEKNASVKEHLYKEAQNEGFGLGALLGAAGLGAAGGYALNSWQSRKKREEEEAAKQQQLLEQQQALQAYYGGGNY